MGVGRGQVKGVVALSDGKEGRKEFWKERVLALIFASYGFSDSYS